MGKGPTSGFGTGNWLVLAAIVGLLAAVWLQLTQLERERLRAAVGEQARDDIQLIRVAVHSALQKQDYQSIDPMLQQWGRSREDTLEIRLVAANGFVIARYQRGGPAGEVLQLSEKIPRSYKGHATLELSKDLAPLEEDVARRQIGLAGGTGIVAFVFWLLLWTNQLRKRETLGLRLRSEALDQAEARLQDAALELERGRHYLKHTLDSIPSILVGVDADSRITQWNKGAEDATHIEAEDALGLPFTELLPQLREQAEQVRQALAGQEERTQRITRVSGGMVHYYRVVISPLPDSAGPGAIIRLDDIGQRVRFEQMMVQSEKMTSMGGLAAGVAHEINNPLSGVLQNCQNLRRRLSTDLQANRQVASTVGIDLERLHEYLRRRKIPQFLDMVKDAAERASRIINDLLVFGRRNPEGFEKVSVTDLLETTLRLASSDYEMRRQTDFNRLEIVRDFAGGLPLLHCERSRIEQALLNLIRNAAQAMALADTPARRRITLRARRDGERALLEVEDNGPGMSDNIRRRAFEPFFTTKAPGAGAGLGLSVVYFIVTQQHGGSIDIASTPSKGSRFSIRLPFTPDPPGKAPGF